MSSSEFTQWMAFYGIEPFGAQRDNLHAAIIASTVANVHRGKNQKAIPPTQFMISSTNEKPSNGFEGLVAFLSSHAVEKKK